MTMTTDITELTAEKLDEVRQRYRPTEVPKCHICGAEMTIQRMSASRITYGCTGATYDETGCHYAEGRSIADDHYAESRITVVDVSDPDVLTLVEALEKAQTERDEFRNRLKLERSILEDADKRIAELESKMANPVQLPHTNGYWTETEKAYEEAITLAKRQIRLAGFRCEGDE
ncbi:ead/Ea22-like family protein [Klebsiella pneumoniae]|uniref:ead/Ea22-like family protein n=1 Tax=Klebsiella pneumoniae TaxID=573 RepID=UPI001F3DBE12|nr:ead/Ea22-like family protein [Klebsiella pneumoniae]MCE7363386.1 ead/Ea22-like family protein [Klebsiella pneumoniae]